MELTKQPPGRMKTGSKKGGVEMTIFSEMLAISYQTKLALKKSRQRHSSHLMQNSHQVTPRILDEKVFDSAPSRQVICYKSVM